MSEDYKNFYAADEVDLAALKLSSVEFEVGKTYRVAKDGYGWVCDELNVGDEFKCSRVARDGSCRSIEVTFCGCNSYDHAGWCVCDLDALRDGFIVEVTE